MKTDRRTAPALLAHEPAYLVGGSHKGGPIRNLGATAVMLVLLAAPVGAFTFTVDSTGDTADTNTADNTCIATGGGCTLRAAIEQANASAGLDTITFGIAGGGVHTIKPGAALPQIVQPVTIDGYQQPGASQNALSNGDNAVILVELDGSMCGGCAALAIAGGGSGSTVRGLAMGQFDNGVILDGAASCAIQGNFIGTDPTGTIARANASEGILLNGGTSNLIGGNTPAARNVISGNGSAGSVSSSAGINLGFGSSANTIQGNFIGVDSTGAVALQNGTDGVDIFGSVQNLVGGTTATERNVISGNSRAGIFISSADQNMVRGNFVGTDVTGTKAVGNAQGGVVVADSAGTMIGGAATGAGNVISANGFEGVGLLVGSTGSIVEGNRIGTDFTGTMLLGNPLRGVFIADSSDNRIGGTDPNAGNLIVGNGTYGVILRTNTTDPTGNQILGNSIFANGDLGIALNNDGPDTNDALDGDTGQNNHQNYPVLDTPMFPGGSSASGTLGSTPGRTYRIEIFGNTACDPSGYGEGQTFLGAVTTGMTDGSGHITFVVDFGQIIGATALTATATDLTTNDTSEFSACSGPAMTTTTSIIGTTTTTSIGGTTTSTTTPSTTSSTTSTSTSTAAPTTVTTSTSTSSSTSSSTSTSTTSTTAAPATTTTLVTVIPPTACSDAAAAAAIEATVEAQCHCSQATNHGAYVRCAAKVAKDAVKAGTLPQHCQGAVKSCASRSTCGKPGFVTCCRTTAKGKTSCVVKRDASHCKPPKRGAACAGERPSCCDACGSGGCADAAAASTEAP